MEKEIRLDVSGSRQSPYNVQATMDTENVFPMIGYACPKDLAEMSITKEQWERICQTGTVPQNPTEPQG